MLLVVILPVSGALKVALMSDMVEPRCTQQ